MKVTVKSKVNFGVLNVISYYIRSFIISLLKLTSLISFFTKKRIKLPFKRLSEYKTTNLPTSTNQPKTSDIPAKTDFKHSESFATNNTQTKESDKAKLIENSSYSTYLYEVLQILFIDEDSVVIEENIYADKDYSDQYSETEQHMIGTECELITQHSYTNSKTLTDITDIEVNNTQTRLTPIPEGENEASTHNETSSQSTTNTHVGNTESIGFIPRPTIGNAVNSIIMNYNNIDSKSTKSRTENLGKLCKGGLLTYAKNAKLGKNIDYLNTLYFTDVQELDIQSKDANIIDKINERLLLLLARLNKDSYQKQDILKVNRVRVTNSNSRRAKDREIVATAINEQNITSKDTFHIPGLTYTVKRTNQVYLKSNTYHHEMLILTFGLIAKLHAKVKEKNGPYHETAIKVYNIIVLTETLLEKSESKETDDIKTESKMKKGSCYHKHFAKIYTEALVELDVNIDNTYFEKLSMPYLLNNTSEDSITKLCQYTSTDIEMKHIKKWILEKTLNAANNYAANTMAKQ